LEEISHEDQETQIKVIKGLFDLNHGYNAIAVEISVGLCRMLESIYVAILV